jgi:hypothetical protein
VKTQTIQHHTYPLENTGEEKKQQKNTFLYGQIVPDNVAATRKKIPLVQKSKLSERFYPNICELIQKGKLTSNIPTQINPIGYNKNRTKLQDHLVLSDNSNGQVTNLACQCKSIITSNGKEVTPILTNKNYGSTHNKKDQQHTRMDLNNTTSLHSTNQDNTISTKTTSRNINKRRSSDSIPMDNKTIDTTTFPNRQKDANNTIHTDLPTTRIVNKLIDNILPMHQTSKLHLNGKTPKHISINEWNKSIRQNHVNIMSSIQYEPTINIINDKNIINKHTVNAERELNSRNVTECSEENNIIDSTYCNTSENIVSCVLSKTVFNPSKGNEITSKRKNDTRLIYQNINSLQPKTTDKWKATIDRIHHFDADVIGLCETSINWNNNNIRQTYSQLLGKKFKTSNMTTSKIHSLPSKIHIPGGCASITVNKMVNKIESSLDDKHNMGRWTGTKY